MKADSCLKGVNQYHFNTSASLLLYTASLGTIFSFYFIFYPTSSIQFAARMQEYNNHVSNIQPQNGSCDLFRGHWIVEATARESNLYTNYSCKTIPFLRNCLMHGRSDTDYLNWRWKPEGCELSRFSPDIFLTLLHGKTMAFIGDSVARNQMESLLCLLSTVEAPKAIHKDAEDRFATWEFQKHNFTLMALWSQFLVLATERVVNGSKTGGFDLHLDKIDDNWSEKLPLIDVAIFSDAHWFFRQNYLFEAGNLIGCIYCQTPNVTDLGPGVAIRKAFRTAFKKINDCETCRVFSLLRTYSPSHFENGAWNGGGGCNKTQPLSKEEINRDASDWDFRKIQVEEVEIARNAGEESGNVFQVLDVTEIMLMRPDGHPGVHWGNQWMKGYSDCIHWCLPGPIDLWNELMLEVIQRQHYHKQKHNLFF